MMGHEIGDSEYPIAKLENLATTFITDVSCGGEYTLACDDQGYAFSWGLSPNNCLGLGLHSSTVVQQPAVICTLLNENIV